ncbi:MAG: homogentisate 1,2-dioxygenase [Bacteroidota bacterium]
MSYYHKLGEIPHKRHTQFRQPDGSLYKEELVSSEGFHGIYSNLYHINAPTRIKSLGESIVSQIERSSDHRLQPVHIKTAGLGFTGKDFLDARLPLLYNSDVIMSLCHPENRTTDYFYKNGEADEVIFVHEGSGYLISQFGKLRILSGDYVVIPRTTIYKTEWDEGPVRLLIIESSSPIETVKRYRNALGQLMEHSPYCERDIRPPSELVREEGQRETLVKVKKQGYMHQFLYDFSPLDVIGWDGFLYPYALSIHDFEPITGRIHQPPPVHQTFQAKGFVICSFVPRLFDYHPLSIPAPYNHSNIDSDEVLYYVDGNFMSRRGIDTGSFTVHPGGIAHGPHPGTAEASIGAKETKELAVMLDTFRPLMVTKQAEAYVDANYPMSWN